MQIRRCYGPIQQYRELFNHFSTRMHPPRFRIGGLELEPTIVFLNSLENRVVRVNDLEGERWVGKFSPARRWTEGALQEEHDFLKEMVDEGSPVVAPVPLSNGATLVDQLSGSGSIPFMWADPVMKWDSKMAYQVGSLVGRLHSRASAVVFAIAPAWVRSIGADWRCRRWRKKRSSRHSRGLAISRPWPGFSRASSAPLLRPPICAFTAICRRATCSPVRWASNWSTWTDCGMKSGWCKTFVVGGRSRSRSCRTARMDAGGLPNDSTL